MILDRIVQIVLLPVSLPLWVAIVAVQRNMEPINLEDFRLV